MIRCNVCGKPMKNSVGGWKEESIPSELMMVLHFFDFPTRSVMRYECSKKHAHAWIVPILTEDKTKTFTVLKH